MSYLSEAKTDAQSTAENFRDEIVEQYMDDTVSDDLLNDYPNGDAYHHENHTDKSYDLMESATILDELDDYEETDSGLWEGLKPREAISAQAAYTYANAVYSMWRDLVEEINDDSELSELKDSYESVEDAVAEELQEHRDEAETGDDYNDEDENFDESLYNPPFEEDAEVEARKATIKANIEARIDAIIAAFAE